jgi:hypothetical protein
VEGKATNSDSLNPLGHFFGLYQVTRLIAIANYFTFAHGCYSGLMLTEYCIATKIFYEN